MKVDEGLVGARKEGRSASVDQLCLVKGLYSQNRGINGKEVNGRPRCSPGSPVEN